MIYTVLICAILLNGATDAANAITGTVSAGLLSYRKASLLSASLNFLGIMIFALFAPALHRTVSDLSSGNAEEAVATLLTVVIFAGGAWLCSLPTSESHAMIAAMAGAGIYKGQELDISLLLFITLGAVLSALMGALFSAAFKRTLPEGLISGRKAAIIGCCATSLLHGAQDGQKFLALAASTGILPDSPLSAAMVAALMFLGTALGGKRIVSKIGEKMTEMDTPCAVASDMGSAVSLLILTLLGIPVSTTHTKTCAIAGASAASEKYVDKRELLSIIIGWVITLPVCMLLGFLISYLLSI